MRIFAFRFGHEEFNKTLLTPFEGGGRAKNLERICRVLKLRSKAHAYNEAAIELHLASLSFGSYESFVPDASHMRLAADAFENVMLDAGQDGIPLGYSIKEIEVMLLVFVDWSASAAR